MFIYLYTYIYIHTYIYVHIDVYIYMYTFFFWRRILERDKSKPSFVCKYLIFRSPLPHWPLDCKIKIDKGKLKVLFTRVASFSIYNEFMHCRVFRNPLFLSAVLVCTFLAPWKLNVIRSMYWYWKKCFFSIGLSPQEILHSSQCN